MAKVAYRTWIAGELVTQDMLNEQIRDNGNEIWVGTTAGDIDYYTDSTHKSRLGIGSAGQLLTVASGAPSWRGYYHAMIGRTTAQSINNNSETTASGYDTEMADTDAFYTQWNSYFTIPVTGLYLIIGNGYWASSVSGGTLRRIGLEVGTLDVYQQVPNVAGETTEMCVYALRVFTAGAQVSMKLFQKSGGALDFFDATLSIARIR